ncbi:MAG: hypothetical protein M1819_004337 [Sarea resinae]|nr:MAG: hypothetical protein M1819_004337 [Sarea resinae]
MAARVSTTSPIFANLLLSDVMKVCACDSGQTYMIHTDLLRSKFKPVSEDGKECDIHDVLEQKFDDTWIFPRMKDETLIRFIEWVYTGTCVKDANDTGVKVNIQLFLFGAAYRAEDLQDYARGEIYHRMRNFGHTASPDAIQMLLDNFSEVVETMDED